MGRFDGLALRHVYRAELSRPGYMPATLRFQRERAGLTEYQVRLEEEVIYPRDDVGFLVQLRR
jgi:hypothetical protein